MNLQDRIRGIATSLLEKSRANQVNWLRADPARDLSGTTIERMYVTLPGAAVYLVYGSPPTEPDYYRLLLVNEGGEVVGFLDASFSKGPGGEDFKLLSDLWEEARRSIVKWDVVIEAIEKSLNQSGTIGLPPREKAAEK